MSINWLNHPYRQEPTVRQSTPDNDNFILFDKNRSARDVGSFKSERQLTLEPRTAKKQHFLGDLVHHQDIDKKNFSSRYVAPSVESNITPDAERPDGVRNRTAAGRLNRYVHPHFREGGRDSAVYRSSHEQWGNNDKLPQNFFWLREESDYVKNESRTPTNLRNFISTSPPEGIPGNPGDPFWEYDQVVAYELATRTSSFVNSPLASVVKKLQPIRKLTNIDRSQRRAILAFHQETAAPEGQEAPRRCGDRNAQSCSYNYGPSAKSSSQRGQVHGKAPIHRRSNSGPGGRHDEGLPGEMASWKKTKAVQKTRATVQIGEGGEESGDRCEASYEDFRASTRSESETFRKSTAEAQQHWVRSLEVKGKGWYVKWIRGEVDWEDEEVENKDGVTNAEDGVKDVCCVREPNQDGIEEYGSNCRNVKTMGKKDVNEEWFIVAEK